MKPPTSWFRRCELGRMTVFPSLGFFRCISCICSLDFSARFPCTDCVFLGVRVLQGFFLHLLCTFHGVMSAGPKSPSNFEREVCCVRWRRIRKPLGPRLEPVKGETARQARKQAAKTSCSRRGTAAGPLQLPSVLGCESCFRGATVTAAGPLRLRFVLQ